MHSCWAMLGDFRECHQERAKVAVASRFLPSSGLEGYGSWADVWAQPHGAKQTLRSKDGEGSSCGTDLFSSDARDT